MAVASAATFGWVGWEMLRQDRAAEEQHERERLESRADRAVQALERVLSEVEEHLAARAAAPAAGLHGAPADGLVLLFDRSAIQPVAPSTLLFYPLLPVGLEPPPSLFAEAEADEFQRRALPRALEAYRRLSQSPDRAVQAAALMRLGRALRQLDRREESLAVYAEMAALADVEVIGLPADLVARDAAMRVLDELGRGSPAEVRARALQHDLANRRWKLTSGQYEHYSANAGRLASGDGVGDEALAAARAVADFWDTWQAQAAPRGRTLAGPMDRRSFIAWRGGGAGFAAWVISPNQLLARLPLDGQPGIAIADANGAILAGMSDASKTKVVRTGVETGLPFTVQAVGSGFGTDSGGLTRGRLVVIGLTVMFAFLLAGSYFIGRAVRQEVALARLQAEFVSAVSHEFRTPLASMRQLSELLAAGRVPLEARRQQYV